MSPELVSAQLMKASVICLRLFEQDMRAAASRTFCTAGNSRPMRTAMMAITTSSSISVNADRAGRDGVLTANLLRKSRTESRERGAIGPSEPFDLQDSTAGGLSRR